MCTVQTKLVMLSQVRRAVSSNRTNNSSSRTSSRTAATVLPCCCAACRNYNVVEGSSLTYMWCKTVWPLVGSILHTANAAHVTPSWALQEACSCRHVHPDLMVPRRAWLPELWTKSMVCEWSWYAHLIHLTAAPSRLLSAQSH